MSVMQSRPRQLTVLFGAALVSVAGIAFADVTIEEKTSMELPIFKAHGNATENFTVDKKRRDYEFHCEGMMSMLCGKAQTSEIVRLDKNMSYELEPAKKTYREQPFPTESERKELQRRLAETMEKMKQCTAQQPVQPAVDTSKCQMSPANVDVRSLGADGQILGHDVHRSVVNLTQSCANKETGDVCDMQFGFDIWLTGDKVAGMEDRVAFDKAYLTKMGLIGDSGAAVQKQVLQMLAPYAEQMKELQAKSGDLKGQALRTAFHVAYGGAHCAAASKANAGGAGSPVGSGDLGTQATDAVAQSTASVAAEKLAGEGVGGMIASRTLSSVGGKLLSGMFAKKKKLEAETAGSGKPAEAAAPAMVTMVRVSTETTAIRTDAVAADRFEIPAGWKRIVPKATGKEEPFSCPKNEKGE